MQAVFARIAGMAGVSPAESAARLLLDHISRAGQPSGRTAPADDPAWARAEAAKWFFHYRRRDIPLSIASYMAEVEALYRAGSAQPAQPSGAPSPARL
jgi:hypothetical protein